MRGVRISAKADYAIRAAVELAAANGDALTTETIAGRQEIPVHFLHKILLELRRAGIVVTLRGRDGGHRLARDPAAITVADVLRVVEGPLADVHGQAPEDLVYAGATGPLQDVWIALRTNIRLVLEGVTLADIAGGALPHGVVALGQGHDARARRATPPGPRGP
jgi:Rrf2 family protein